EAATRAGEGPLHEQQVAIRVRANDAHLLDGDAFVAHVARHPQAAIDATRRRTRADRPGCPVVVGTVGLRTALEVVAFDDAGRPLAFGDAGHVDEVAGGEQVTDR